MTGESGPVAGEAVVAIRGGAIRVIGYASGVLVSLGVAAVLVRHLGVAGFGRYVTVTSLIALVGGVTEAGIVVYGIREYLALGQDERRRLMENLLGLRLALTAVGVAAAVVFALVAGYRQALVLGTLIAGAGLLAQVVADVLSVSLQARLRLGRLTGVELTRRTLTLLFAAALALLGAGLLPFLAASAVATAIATALMIWVVRGDLLPRARFERAAWRRLFADTLPYAIAMSITAVYVYVTVILVSLIASGQQTGLFATSFRVIQAALAIPSLLLTAAFPLMARPRPDQRQALAETFSKVLTVAVVCGLWMSIAIALGATFIVDAIGGAAARGAAPTLRIQGLVLTMAFVSTSSALTLVALRRYRALAAASVCMLAVDVVAGLILIPSLGARGGAIADVIAEGLAAVAMTAVVLRGRPRPRLIRPADQRACALACVLAGAAVALPVGSLGRAAVATGLYFAVIVKLNVLPAEVTQVARRLGRRASR